LNPAFLTASRRFSAFFLFVNAPACTRYQVSPEMVVGAVKESMPFLLRLAISFFALSFFLKEPAITLYSDLESECLRLRLNAFAKPFTCPCATFLRHDDFFIREASWLLSINPFSLKSAGIVDSRKT